MTTRRAIAALAAGVLALGAAGCAADDPQPTDPAPPPVTAPPAEESPAAPGEDETETGQDQDPETRNAAAAQAISTAADEVGGTPYEIDDADDDGTWEVSVMVDDRSHDVTVSEDGMTVVEQQDEAADDEDRARLDQAGLGLAQAIEAALGEVQGTLDDVELGDDDGAPVWEVSINTAENDDVDVLIDVRDGSVLRVDR
ncbi:MAG TPA: PepSY domain-containing protein [Propionibacterium sp.]|nr:PepSY domain-containing protein [Propionibacterium sp.]